MAVLVVDAVERVPCDDCPRFRTLVTEDAVAGAAARVGPLVRVTVMGGCEACEGSTVIVRR